MTSGHIAIAPSILSADFARLGEQVADAEAGGADLIHVDVMDGHFVPNLTIGPLVVRALRRVTRLPLETHLMIEEPDRWLDAFADAGSTALVVHVEGAVHLHRTLERIRSLGLRVGVAINPATPVGALEEVVAELDLVLVMTVDPGFGGQAFIASVLPKIRRVRELLDRVRPQCEIHVDGGIDATTAPLVVAEGANVLVAGSAVFGDASGGHGSGGDVERAIERLRASIEAAGGERRSG
jgi:ribulose-phosphate 3-epimerase